MHDISAFSTSTLVDTTSLFFAIQAVYLFSVSGFGHLSTAGDSYVEMGTLLSRHGIKAQLNQTEQKSSQRASQGRLPEPEFGDHSSLVFPPKLADRLSDLQYIVNDIDTTGDIYKQDAPRSVDGHERDKRLSEQCNRTSEARNNEKNQSNDKTELGDKKRNKDYNKPATEGQACVKEELHQVVVKQPIMKETKERDSVPIQSCFGGAENDSVFNRLFDKWFSTNEDSHHEMRSRFELWIESIKRRIIFWRWYEHHRGSVVRIVRFLQGHVRKRGDDIVFVF